MHKNKEVILLLAHKVDDGLRKLYTSLKDAGRETTLIYTGKKLDDFGENIFWFREESIPNLGYSLMHEKIVPGQAHFPILDYHNQSARKYTYYWVIEYDVRFTGRWEKLIDYYVEDESDFITSRIKKYHDFPNWSWWKLTHPTKKVPIEDRLKSFNPIYRISSRALDTLHQKHLSGWRGHFEVLIPSLLMSEGLSLRDFGGTGEFVRPGDENKWYSTKAYYVDRLHSGTMRYRPIMNSPGYRTDKIYHPVKPGKGGIVNALIYIYKSNY